MLGKRRFGVGIVGMAPGRSWSAVAHLPALRCLADDFEVVGVANSTEASSRAAAEAEGLPRGFRDLADLLAAPEVDIVAVNVKAPLHHGVVTAALAAGKAIYCEWPLGVDAAQSAELAGAARKSGVLAVCGTQGRGSIEAAYVAGLIRDGYVGRLLSVSLMATGIVGIARLPSYYAYSLDKGNGASMLTLSVGHTLAMWRDMFGPLAEVSARLAVRQPFSTIIETGEQVAKTAHDQALIHGVLEDGTPLSIHYRSGVGAQIGLHWQIQGDAGMIQITSAAHGHTHTAPLTIQGAQGQEALQVLTPPAELYAGWPQSPTPRNVARLYQRMAEDLRTGSSTAPTFDEAAELHRVIAAIEAADASGCRVRL